MIQLHDQQQFLQVDKPAKYAILKHSSTCPISFGAWEEVQNYLEEHAEAPLYYLVVQDARPLSLWLAERYGVKHESPQLLVIENDEVTFHTSHWNITYSELAKQLGE